MYWRSDWTGTSQTGALVDCEAHFHMPTAEIFKSVRCGSILRDFRELFQQRISEWKRVVMC